MICWCKDIKWVLLVIVVLVLIYTLTLQIISWSSAVQSTEGCKSHRCCLEVINGLPQPSLVKSRSFDGVTIQFLLDVLARLTLNNNVDGWVPTAHFLVKKKTVGTLFLKQGAPQIGMLAFPGPENTREFVIDLATSQQSFSPFRILTDLFPSSRSVVYPIKAWDKHRHKPVRPKELFATRDTHDIVIHGKMYRGYLKVRSEMWNAIHSLSSPLETLFITGYSLGGGLAMIAALDLLLNYAAVGDVRLYTFGAPRVGNQWFANALNQAPALSQFYQIQNTADVVTTMPQAVLPNSSDPTRPFYYSHGGTPVTFPANWGSMLLNHLLSNYVQGVQTMLQK